MRSARKILMGSLIVGAAGIGSYVWSQHQDIAPPVLRTTADTNTTNAEKTLVTSPGIAEASASREDTTQPVLTPEQLEEKYAGYQVQGFVHMHQKPLQDVVVEALMARSVVRASPAWTTKTDHTGRFYLKVPHNTLYDVEARFQTNQGAKKTREITNVNSEREGDKQLIEIEFSDTPDVLVQVEGSSLIKRAYLQKENKTTLEGLVQGAHVRFEDVDPKQLYNLCILTEDPAAPIVDSIPVFEEDVARVYRNPATKWSQITVVDKKTKQRIPQAQIDLTLTGIEPSIYKQTLVTDQQGVWSGFIGNHLFITDISANGYIREIASEGVKLRENNLLELRRGATLAGQVLDEQQRPVENAEVYLLDPLGMSPLKNSAVRRTDAEGRFVLTNIDPQKRPPFDTRIKESFIPVAVKPGYIQPQLEIITADARDIRLQLSHPKETLEGRIVDQQGAPVQALVEMYLVSLQGHQQEVSNTPFWLKDKKETDHQGRFVWSQLPAGTYALRIQPGGNDKGYLTTITAATVPSNPKDILVTQGILLEGRVLAEETGLAVPNANVSVKSKDSRIETNLRSDEQGRFKGFVPPGEGSYFMWVRNAARRDILEEEQGNYRTGQPLQIMVRKKDYMQIIVRDEVTQQPLQQYKIIMNEQRGDGKYANTRNGFDPKGITEVPLLYPMDLWVTAPGYSRSSVLKVNKDQGNQSLYIDMKKK
ncbi:MAG: carboxypeptidase-like regulatory domain-containing protein [Candidatus Woesearchaeota archaeon]|nr:carboxypeptidase-like regulatory domain-containing protein [Candidatus Woesearchaeota archaeon]